jgi:hypothetical protein
MEFAIPDKWNVLFRSFCANVARVTLTISFPLQYLK